MAEGASERARNCESVGWTFWGQKEAGAEERKLVGGQRDERQDK
jgi:hypothetical protein